MSACLPERWVDGSEMQAISRRKDSSREARPGTMVGGPASLAGPAGGQPGRGMIVDGYAFEFPEAGTVQHDHVIVS